MINSSFLRMLRIIRISRLARVARIMRSVPEVMRPRSILLVANPPRILFQGMGAASRSVICALSLLAAGFYMAFRVVSVIFSGLRHSRQGFHALFRPHPAPPRALAAHIEL